MTTSLQPSSLSFILTTALIAAQEQLAAFASKADFFDNFYLIFGNSFSIPTALTLQEQWLYGDFTNLPRIEIRSNDELRGAFGAYSALTDTIYISQEFLEFASPEQVVTVLLEEIGHSVDTYLNSEDALGDEGEIFSALAWGNDLNSTQLAALQSQNDQAILNLDGVLIPVETSSLLGEQVDVDVRFTTFADSFVDVSLFSTTFTVGAGQEVTSQSVSTTFQGGGFPQTLSGNISINVGSDTIFTNFSGTAQPGSVKFIFSSLVGGPVAGIGSATETANSGVVQFVNSTFTPTVSNDVVTTGFVPFGFQPGTNISQTVQLGFSSPNQVPSFNDGTSTSLTLDEDSAAVSITNLLDITDADTGDSLTWSISSGPGNGALSGFNATSTSNGSTVTPTSLFYTPTANSSGADSFSIQVSDGTDTDTITVNVTINDAPEVSSINLGNPNPTKADNLTFAVTFSENVTGVDAGDFDLVKTGTASGNITSISGSGNSYTVTVNNVSGDGTLGLNLIDDDSILNSNNVELGGVGTSGNGSGSFTTGQTYTLDNTVPGAASTPDLTAATDTGNSNTDNITNDTTPTFTGTAEANSTVILTSNVNGTIGTTTTDGAGNWSITASTLSTGNHTITATATDAAGNTSTASSALAISIDGSAPTVTVDIVDASLNDGDNSSQVTFEFSETVSGFTVDDLTPSGGTLSGFTQVDGDSYTATFTANDNVTATGSVTVDANSYTDTAGNTGSTGSDTVSIATASTIAFSAANFNSNEDVGTSNAVTLTRTGDTSGTSSVQVSITGGTATGSGTDYTSSSFPLTVSFAPGETSKTVTIPINDDSLNEADEPITLSLGSASNATIGTQNTTALTIIDNDPQPTISIGDTTFGEGDGTASFTVSLSTASGKAISVDYATVDGTATAGSDYTANSGTLNFAAGETSKNITVNISEDASFEGPETFLVDLTSPTNATIADAQGQGTINDNDVIHAIAASITTVTEGDTGVQTVTFTISRTGATSQPTTIDYAFSGTAILNTDYNNIGGTSGASATTGTVSFAAGETSKTITVDVIGDTLDETDNVLTVTLSNASVGTISTTAQSLTITDDDAAPTISVNNVSVDEGAGTTTFTVSLSAASGKAISIDYATADDTATAGSDYTASSGTLNFAAGETSKTLTINIAEDSTDEINETFNLNLNNPTNTTIANGQGQATIIDNDAAPTLSISDPTVNEGAGTATFTVNLSAASAKTVTVNYATADSTAVAGSDYTATGTQTLTFNPGDTTKTVTVNISEDVLDEADETFTVNLSGANNATIANATGQGTITDNDAEPTVSFTAASQSISENTTSVAITAQLNAVSGKDVTLPFSVNGSSTASGSVTDYSINASPLMITAGNTTTDIVLTLNNDALDEVDETVVIDLGTPTNATATGITSHTVTITDDDAAPTISVNDVSVAEGDTGTTNATFTISLSAASGKSISVNYATADNSATLANSDYNANSGNVTFNPGETIKTVNVAIIGDGTEESDEAFFFDLNTPTNATIADAQGIGTIQDDDVPTLITGGNGNDTLVGTPGKDNLVGNVGPDILTGGAGEDHFIMTSSNDRQDTITDFTSGDDVINLVSLFDQYGITTTTYTAAAAQGYLSIITNGAGGSIVRFDSNGDGGFFDFTTPVNFIVVQGVTPAALANDANFVLQ